jgi:hypothetical protein
VAPIIGGRLFGLGPVDPDRLGHNYGPPVGKVGEDPSTQALMVRPAPPDVATAMQGDHAIGWQRRPEPFS